MNVPSLSVLLLIAFLVESISSHLLFVSVSQTDQITFLHDQCKFNPSVVGNANRICVDFVVGGPEVGGVVGALTADAVVEGALGYVVKSAGVEGLSGLVFILNDGHTAGNAALQAVMRASQAIFFKWVPLWSINNTLGPLGVTPLMQAIDRNTFADASSNYVFQLPPNYPQLLAAKQYTELHQALITSSLQSCAKVQEQQKALLTNITKARQKEPKCPCTSNCRRLLSYCCQTFFGVCVTRCDYSWVDARCQRSVEDCYKNFEEVKGPVPALCTLADNLSTQYFLLSQGNALQLNTCTQLKQG